jgi:transcriptional regulator with XRE-family HTH domain
MIMRLRDARKASGLTQYQLAERLNVSQPLVCMWESGQEKPSDEQRRKISQILAFPVAWHEMRGPLNTNEQQLMFRAIEIAAHRIGHEAALRLFADQDPDGIRQLTEFALTLHERAILLPPDVESKRTK